MPSGWLGGMLCSILLAVSSVGCFCGARNPDLGALRGSARFLESIVPAFVCSASSQQPPSRRGIKGSRRDLAPAEEETRAGKRGCAPRPSPRQPSPSTACTSSPACAAQPVHLAASPRVSRHLGTWWCPWVLQALLQGERAELCRWRVSGVSPVQLQS